MEKHIETFLFDISGSTAIEYALLASMIGLAIVTIVGNIGTKLSGEYSEISAAFK